jgi:hypothetical protein
MNTTTIEEIGNEEMTLLKRMNKFQVSTIKNICEEIFDKYPKYDNDNVYVVDHLIGGHKYKEIAKKIVESKDPEQEFENFKVDYISSTRLAINKYIKMNERRDKIMNISNNKDIIAGLIKTIKDCVARLEIMYAESLIYDVEAIFGEISFDTTEEFFENETENLVKYVLENRTKFLSELVDIIEYRENIINIYGSDYIDDVCCSIIEYAEKFY